MEILPKIHLQTENLYKINIFGRDREFFLVKVKQKKTQIINVHVFSFRRENGVFFVFLSHSLCRFMRSQ